LLHWQLTKERHKTDGHRTKQRPGIYGERRLERHVHVPLGDAAAILRWRTAITPGLADPGDARLQAAVCAKTANWRSSSLSAPLRQPSATDCDAGSGKMSCSPFSNPSKMPRAAVSTGAFGTSKPRFMSVSMGPRMTAWTETPWPARNARNDCVMLKAAAFEME